MPLPKRRFLDPRPRGEAIHQPIADAVNIPLAELAHRSHELPHPSEVILITAEPGLAASTGEWLDTVRRRWESVPFERTDSYLEGRLWSPHPLVEEVCRSRVPGLAWDLGCGAGRDAIYLASAGWQVIAIDRLADAVERGKQTATRLLGNGKDNLDWVIQDFAKEKALPENRPDLVVMIYFLDRAVLLQAMDRLAPGGEVLLETFTPKQRSLTGRPKSIDLVLDEPEARKLFTGFEVTLCEEDYRDGRHTLRVRACKPQS